MHVHERVGAHVRVHVHVLVRLCVCARLFSGVCMCLCTGVQLTEGAGGTGEAAECSKEIENEGGPHVKSKKRWSERTERERRVKESERRERRRHIVKSKMTETTRDGERER